MPRHCRTPSRPDDLSSTDLEWDQESLVGSSSFDCNSLTRHRCLYASYIARMTRELLVVIQRVVVRVSMQSASSQDVRGNKRINGCEVVERSSNIGVWYYYVSLLCAARGSIDDSGFVGTLFVELG